MFVVVIFVAGVVVISCSKSKETKSMVVDKKIKESFEGDTIVAKVQSMENQFIKKRF